MHHKDRTAQHSSLSPHRLIIYRYVRVCYCVLLILLYLLTDLFRSSLCYSPPQIAPLLPIRTWHGHQAGSTALGNQPCTSSSWHYQTPSCTPSWASSFCPLHLSSYSSLRERSGRRQSPVERIPCNACQYDSDSVLLDIHIKYYCNIVTMQTGGHCYVTNTSDRYSCRDSSRDTTRPVHLASSGFGDVEVVTRRQDRALPEWMMQLQRKGEKQELQRATVSAARSPATSTARFAERVACGSIQPNLYHAKVVARLACLVAFLSLYSLCVDL